MPKQGVRRAKGIGSGSGGGALILLIDNYDSFSWNLFQLAGEIEPDIRVIRNDELTSDKALALNPDCVIISPGLGRPENAGICIDLIQKNPPSIPLLGICLGHQAICAAFGAVVTYARKLMHGKSSIVCIDSECPIFSGCGDATEVARYHSLAADPATLPACLKVTAKAGDGEVMAVMHAEKPIFGLQFHPESILTPLGKIMIANFIGLSR